MWHPNFSFVECVKNYLHTVLDFNLYSLYLFLLVTGYSFIILILPFLFILCRTVCVTDDGPWHQEAGNIVLSAQ